MTNIVSITIHGIAKTLGIASPKLTPPNPVEVYKEKGFSAAYNIIQHAIDKKLEFMKDLDASNAVPTQDIWKMYINHINKNNYIFQKGHKEVVKYLGEDLGQNILNKGEISPSEEDFIVCIGVHFYSLAMAIMERMTISPAAYTSSLNEENWESINVLLQTGIEPTLLQKEVIRLRAPSRTLLLLLQ